jgi:hypothetical protein
MEVHFLGEIGLVLPRLKEMPEAAKELHSLVAAERDHGIDFRSATCRDVARRKACSRENDCDAAVRDGIERANAVQPAAKHDR